VNDVNKCYKLKLFFQQFFINTAVLNAEVPLNSRLHILEVRRRYCHRCSACFSEMEPLSALELDPPMHLA
jgi:hypothetical protein